MKTQQQLDADFILGLRESFCTDPENGTKYDSDPTGAAAYNAGWELGQPVACHAGPERFREVRRALGIDA